MTDAVVTLDENVVTQELLLQSLLKRKELLSNQKVGMETRLDQHRQELQELEATEERLKLSRNQHLELQQELEQKLAKSEEKYSARCGTTSGASIDLTMEEQDVGSEDLTDQQEDNQLNKSEEFLKQEQGTEGVDSPVKAVPAVEPIQSETNFPGLLTGTDLVTLSTNFDFLTLHVCCHGDRLQRMMSLLTNQYQVLDELCPDGQHRRTGLEFSILMPFTLSLNDTTTSQQKSSALSNEIDEALDHGTTICPYELAGECADPFCTFQHLQERKVEARQLVKELLPLPDVKLPHITMRYVEEDGDDDYAYDERHEAVEAGGDKRELALDERSVDGEHGTFASTPMQRFKPSVDAVLARPSAQKPPPQASLDFDEDFIALPPAAGVDEPEEVEEIDASDESLIPSYWWMTDEDKERVTQAWPSVGHLSFTEWLELVFDFRTIVSNTGSTSIHLPGAPSKRGDMASMTAYNLPRIGKAVDAIKLALHAGRHDMAFLISEMFSESMHGCNLCGMGQTKTQRAFRKFLLKNFQDWQPNSIENCSIFETMFRAQLVLWCTSEWVRVAYNHFLSGDGAVPWFDNVLICIIDRFPEEEIAAVTGKIKCKDMISLGCVVRQIQSILHVFPKKQSQTQRPILQTEICPDADLILSCFSAIRAARGLLDRKNGTTKEIVALTYKLENVCSLALKESHPNFRVIVSPVVALQVSFQIALRRYDKAQRTLETVLVHDVIHLSDQLWSQLVLLRCALPLQNVDSLGALLETVDACGVWFNHLTMPGDRNLLRCFQKDEACTATSPFSFKKGWKKQYQTNVTTMAGQLHKAMSGSTTDLVDIDLVNFKLVGKPAHLAVPSVVLMAGFVLRKLSIQGCCLEELPIGFGTYFPFLEELDLSDNRLSRLQQSFDKLKSLKKLAVSANDIVDLGDGIGGCASLEELIARDNQLSTLPDVIARCKKLWHIDASNNLFKQQPPILVRMEALSLFDMSVTLDKRPPRKRGKRRRKSKNNSAEQDKDVHTFVRPTCTESLGRGVLMDTAGT